VPAPTTCTIIARNYAAHARVLARSFADHHPGQRLQVLIIDDREAGSDWSEEPFDVVTPLELPLEVRTLHEMAMCYEVMELATALKPWLMRLMLQRSGGGPVLYLDPDILVLAPLDAMTTLLGEHQVVLTPHTTEPIPRDGRQTSEVDILASGVYNLGFLGVSAGCEPFLDWWSERLRLDSIVDHANMLFTDQRWIDLAVPYFAHHLLRDPGYNVAYWNAYQRPVERVGEGYRAGGEPLRCFHFSGFDPLRPHILSRHQGDRPRVLPSEHPAVAALCRDYASRLLAEGYLEARQVPFAWATLPDGTAIDKRMRRSYRTGLVRTDTDGEPRPPDPFDPSDAEALYAWFATPDKHFAPAPSLPRYLWEVYAERPDLQQSYPLVSSVDEAWYKRWLLDYGRTEVDAPPALMPLVSGEIPWGTQVPESAPPEELRPGILVSGYLRAEVGVGQAARLAMSVIEAAGVTATSYVYGLTPSRQEHPWGAADATRADLDTNLVCVNSDQLADFALIVGPDFFEGRYTVGSWMWETERLPERAGAASELLDEIWVSSAYTLAAVTATVKDTPAFVFPHPVVVPPVSAAHGRDDLGMPGGYVFLFMFDFLSTIARKNPLGLIEAFSRAFRPDEGPQLVLKSINGQGWIHDLERVRLAVAERPDIHLIDRYATRAELNAMLALCNCYVSLHRAEGFGLTIADAMALGKPAIATAYSGNLEFMDPDTSHLVPYSLTTVGTDTPIYPAEDKWAEPDLDAAAEAMRRVYRDRDGARRMAELGRERVLRHYGMTRSVSFLKERLGAIRQMRADGYTSEVAEAVRRRVGRGGTGLAPQAD
jgi:glycosyltransferase involved in cell wall biosynthesis